MIRWRSILNLTQMKTSAQIGNLRCIVKEILRPTFASKELEQIDNILNESSQVSLSHTDACFYKIEGKYFVGREVLGFAGNISMIDNISVLDLKSADYVYQLQLFNDYSELYQYLDSCNQSIVRIKVKGFEFHCFVCDA